MVGGGVGWGGGGGDRAPELGSLPPLQGRKVGGYPSSRGFHVLGSVRRNNLRPGSGLLKKKHIISSSLNFNVCIIIRHDVLVL